LDKQFNRIEFQVSPQTLEQTNVFTKLEMDLPQTATDVYYRDEVGNISTSHFRKQITKSILELQPRFPLFGGWKTAWYTGYNVPITHYVRYVNQSDVFVLKAKFVENLKNMVADQVEFTVILPEGAV
jgi:oligosaccharyltransferase complex subunit alpha (ribophorin I)